MVFFIFLELSLLTGSFAQLPPVAPRDLPSKYVKRDDRQFVTYERAMGYDCNYHGDPKLDCSMINSTAQARRKALVDCGKCFKAGPQDLPYTARFCSTDGKSVQEIGYTDEQCQNPQKPYFHNERKTILAYTGTSHGCNVHDVSNAGRRGLQACGTEDIDVYPLTSIDGWYPPYQCSAKMPPKYICDDIPASRYHPGHNCPTKGGQAAPCDPKECITEPKGPEKLCVMEYWMEIQKRDITLV